MKSRYYERIWHEIIDDPKLGPLSDSLKWRFVTLILAAGQHGHNGELPALPDLAWRLRASEEQLRTELPTLAQRELIELLPSGRWYVTNYAKRQAAMSGAERMQRKRAADRSYPQASYPQASASASSTAFPLQEEEVEEVEESIVNICDEPSQQRHVRHMLSEKGISINRTTLRLLDLDPAYVAAHLAAADPSGLIIRRMLDGDPPPKRNRHVSAAEVEDIIRR